MRYIGLLLAAIVFLASCRDARIHEEQQWGTIFAEYGIDTVNACFMLRDNNHEAVHYFNKERCLERYAPGFTFDIFNAMVALDIPKVPDESFVIPWDSVERGNEAWNKDMDMREAFKVNSFPYFQSIANRIGADYMQHYLDTANYGNKSMGDSNDIDGFWVNENELEISADEQVGLIKRLYFNQLPFDDRSQRIVRSMMLMEDTDSSKLYYKTGFDVNKQVSWVVGFVERIVTVEEDERAMNKSDERRYPYFFAMNYTGGLEDHIEIELLKKILKEHGAIRTKG